MSDVFTIGGVPADLDAMDAIPIRFAERLGDVPHLTVQRRGIALPDEAADPWLGQTLEWSHGGTTYFSGDIVSRSPRHDDHLGWTVDYQALGIRRRAALVPLTDDTFLLDTSPYNCSPEDLANFRAARAGRTVGEILTDVLTGLTNAANLDAYGIGGYTGLPSAPALPSATTTDLATLTIVPPQPVYVTGEKLIDAIDGFLQRCAPNYRCWIMPDGTIRFLDTRAFTPTTLTMGSDPIQPVELSRDVECCFQRVLVRGAPVAIMFLFKLSQGTLSEEFAHDGLSNSDAKALWLPSDFKAPGNGQGTATAHTTIGGGAVTAVVVDYSGYGYGSAPTVSLSGGGGSGATATATLTGDKVTSIAVGAGGSGYTTAPTVTIQSPRPGLNDVGTCTMGSTTTVTVTSGSASTRWGSNFWDQTVSGAKGIVNLFDSAGAGLTMMWTARAVSNTSLSPGGTSTITIDAPAPSTSFDHYTITGNAQGAAIVWRQYRIVDATLRDRVVAQSTYPQPFINAGGGATVTSSPMGAVLWPQSGSSPPYNMFPLPFVVSDGGYITFVAPTYIVAQNSAPADVWALIPINTGPNQVASPVDVLGVPQFAGTSNAIEGRTDTLVVTMPDWRDPGLATQVQDYADDLLDSVKDAAIEGSLMYHGLWTPALSFGVALNVAGVDDAGSADTTGWESAEIPILGVELEWSQGGEDYVTTINCSSRRAHYSAEMFLRPERTWMPIGLGEGSEPMVLGGLIDVNPSAGLDTAIGQEGLDQMRQAGASGIAGMLDQGNQAIAGMTHDPFEGPGSNLPEDPGDAWLGTTGSHAERDPNQVAKADYARRHPQGDE